MLKGYPRLVQALLGSLFTWGLTAVGAAAVFCCTKENDLILDVSLGFASGVMTAASFWSLLAPAIEFAANRLGKHWAIAPVAGGFVFGALFVYCIDRLFVYFGFSKSRMLDAIEVTFQQEGRPAATSDTRHYTDPDPVLDRPRSASQESTEIELQIQNGPVENSSPKFKTKRDLSWRRLMLLIVAITVHNIPEGLAVGVAFGAIGKTDKATFESAFNLALGIGIQNFPEGLAVSLPLVGFGYSKYKAFFYGQLSGMVEPVAALLGAAAVQLMEPVLPYALAFAAGAMIFVVMDDIVPEAQVHGYGKWASWGSIAGFVVMMSLDVTLG